MIRLSALLWLALVVVTGFVMFKVKYTVQDIEEELNRVRKQTVVEHQEIHLLRAEWTTLNQPERLADLNRRFLSLTAVAPKQLQRAIEDVALRPSPSPPDTLIASTPAAPDTLIAAAPAVPEPAVPQLAASEAQPAQPAKPMAAIAAALMPVKPAAAAPLAVSGAQNLVPEHPVAATPAASKSAPVKPAAAVQLAKTGAPRPAPSIDRLFAEIAGGR